MHNQVNPNKYPLLKKKRNIVKHQNCMLLHCMYNKRKVTVILGGQVLNSEVRYKKHEIQSNTVITMQKIYANEQKATVKTIIDFIVLL